MDAPEKNLITVPWQTESFGFSETAAHLWNSMRGSAPDRRHAKIEQALHWPPGVIAILAAAFAQELSRTTPWDLRKISSRMEIEAFRVAARVFRRGVGTSHSDEGRASTQGSYQIRFLSSQTIVEAAIAKAKFIIVDQNVEIAWPHLEESRHYQFLAPSEQSKDLTHVAKLIAAWEAAGKPNDWLVIGGGLCSDVAGFAANVVHQEISIMPTTLLAMVDASVGGKTGVNFPPYGKNQVGSFHFPREVLIWPGWLQTLSARTLRGGGAECLKHAILAKNRRTIKSLGKMLAAVHIDDLAGLLPELVEVKADIVAEDPTECGRRAILNLGHTLGHALEAYSAETRVHHYQIMEHGEAVAFGICFAALLSQRLGYLAEADCAFIWEIFQSAQCLPSRVLLENYLGTQDLKADKLWTELYGKLLQDKKQSTENNGAINFVLLAGIGKIVQPTPSVYTVAVPPARLRACWKDFLKKLH